jgi:dimeric dUTPase (all-alpha-NTP-PPase superfamily)
MFGEGLVLIGVDCDVVDVVMSRRLGDTDMLEVFKQLVRDIAGFSKI